MSNTFEEDFPQFVKNSSRIGKLKAFPKASADGIEGIGLCPLSENEYRW